MPGGTMPPKAITTIACGALLLEPLRHFGIFQRFGLIDFQPQLERLGLDRSGSRHTLPALGFVGPGDHAPDFNITLSGKPLQRWNRKVRRSAEHNRYNHNQSAWDLSIWICHRRSNQTAYERERAGVPASRRFHSTNKQSQKRTELSLRSQVITNFGFMHVKRRCVPVRGGPVRRSADRGG